MKRLKWCSDKECNDVNILSIGEGIPWANLHAVKVYMTQKIYIYEKKKKILNLKTCMKFPKPRYFAFETVHDSYILTSRESLPGAAKMSRDKGMRRHFT